MSECKQQTPIRFGPVAPSLNSLRGIRYFAPDENEGTGGANGGSGGDGGNDGGNGDGGNSGGGSNGGDGGSNQQQQQGGNGSNGGSSRGGSRSKQETFSREYVEELRGEAATNRRTASSEKTRADTAEREREEARQEAATLRRERAIERTAPKAGANPDALLDSAAFARETKDLDLNDAEAVKKAIEAFVEKNPHVAAAPSGPGSSGSGRPGGSSSEGPKHENSLAGAVGAALGG